MPRRTLRSARERRDPSLADVAYITCERPPGDLLAPAPWVTIDATQTTLGVTQGDAFTIDVTIARVGWTGDVEIAVQGLPSGVTVDPLTIADGATTGTINGTASAGAALGAATLTVLTVPPAGVIVGTDTVALTVFEGTDPVVTVALDPTIGTLAEGDTLDVLVTVTRGGGFTDAVPITVSGLPTGVTASALTIAAAPTVSGTVTLTASGSTPVVAAVTVAADAVGATNGSAELALTVTEAPASGGVPAAPAYTRPEVPFTKTAAEIHYIDADLGNDANAGTEAAPWQSLSKIRGAGMGGHTFYCKGTFGSGHFVRPLSGTAAKYTLVKKWPGAETFACPGSCNSSAYGAIHMPAGTQYAVVDGLTIYRHASDTWGSAKMLVGATTPPTGGLRYYVTDIQLLNITNHGTYVDGDATTATICYTSLLWYVGRAWVDGCSFDVIGHPPAHPDNGGDALHLRGCDDVTVVRNTIGRCGHAGMTIDGAGLAAWTSHRTTVALNSFVNTWTEGLNCNGFQEDTLIEWNTFRDCGELKANALSKGGIMVNGTRTIVRRNTIINTNEAAIKLQAYTYGGIRQDAIECEITHNTIYGNGTAFDIRVRYAATCRDNVIANNIFYDCNLKTPPTEGGYGTYGGWSHPLIVDLSNMSEAAEWADWYVGGVLTLNGNVVKNNIFNNENAVSTSRRLCYVIPKTGEGSASTQFALATPAALTVQWPDCTGNQYDATTQIDPLFADTTPDAEDLSLTVGSPAIDAGALLGGDVYVGDAPDIGASEYGP